MKQISKTSLTRELENKLWDYTNKQGTFRCFEVTIGWYGSERVDMLSYDTQGIWRCYEIKASKSDFYSKAKWTFIGHYNYFIMTEDLFEQVKHDIPPHIGVHTGFKSLKQAKKQELQIDEQVLKDSLIRSLSRESSKLYEFNNSDKFNELKNENSKLLKQNKELKKYKIVSAAVSSMIRHGDNLEEIEKHLKNLINK